MPHANRIDFVKDFITQAPSLLHDSYVRVAQLGHSEIITVLTENGLAEKFRIEILYSVPASRNGNLPIISAILHTHNRNDVQLSRNAANALIKMCYAHELAQQI